VSDRLCQDYCFRLHNDRVYYLSAALLLTASSFPRDSLVHAGCCFGKFTKSRQFRLHVTCLDYLHQHARHKLWLRANGEMSFLYGNHALKAHVGRLTEAAPQYAGVVVVTMADIPLGFGVMAMSTAECRKADSTAVVAFHQADVGEYLRTEQEL
jgi:60S ribosome subunit biogenesis protein NIP7